MVRELLHKKIWKLLGKKVDLLQEDKYSPSSFSPHLTIPIFNPNKRNVLKIIKYLMDLDLNLNIISDKISFINTSKETGKVKIYFTCKSFLYYKPILLFMGIIFIQDKMPSPVQDRAG